ncbi:MFS transporter [Halothermothrix orenii]|uniref:Major facilitator superfamily MFS_1 n=1 Tax=Halothermothrix orenii (strain H 168 / OCM 544 / DSM 9562) TaxID=373903 RepID=B8CX10_HALOH|nr:MFS transporter [Halothermothrix orenii]ACL69829.1 major facilitator superfamily MFS_1 [Halothermothrix orenii H 168]
MNFKLFNFFFYITAAALTYINVYFKKIGFTTGQIGLIQSVPAAISLLVMPLWGMASDYFNSNKRLLIYAITGTIILNLVFLTTEYYWYIFIIMVFFVIFQKPVIPLADALLLNYLGKRGNLYGRYRVWGSIGFTITVWLIGYYLENTNPANLFYINAVALLVALLFILKVPEGKEAIRVNRLKEFTGLLKNMDLFYFLLFTFFIQLTLFSNYTFFPLYVLDNGSRESLIGLALTVGATSEMFIFVYSDNIFRKFKIKSIFMISSIAFTLRWFLLAYFPVSSVFIGSQLLHSLTFGLFHVTAVNYINIICGEDFKATGQNLYATMLGISSIVGNYLGGNIYENMGGNKLYFYWALITLISGLIYYINLSLNKNKTYLVN